MRTLLVKYVADPLMDFLAVFAVNLLNLLGWRACLKIGSVTGRIASWV